MRIWLSGTCHLPVKAPRHEAFPACYDIQFAEQPRNRNTTYSRPMRFNMICEANGIEHRLTKPNHPWTNGQVERMNRTIKEAPVNRRPILPPFVVSWPVAA